MKPVDWGLAMLLACQSAAAKLEFRFKSFTKCAYDFSKNKIYETINWYVHREMISVWENWSMPEVL